MIECPERRIEHIQTQILEALMQIQHLMMTNKQIETPENGTPRIYDTARDIHRIACTLRGIESLLAAGESKKGEEPDDNEGV